MAVSNTDFKKVHAYVGLGDYEISFDFDVNESVVVFWTSDAGADTTGVEGVDYEIVSVGANAYVRVLIDFGTGGKLTAYRSMDYTQTYTFVDGRDPAPSAIMRALDRIVWMIQQVAGLAANALQAPLTESNDMTIPNAASRRGGILGFTDDEFATPVAVAGISDVPVSLFMAPHLLASDAASFRSGLDIASDADLATERARVNLLAEDQKRMIVSEIKRQMIDDIVLYNRGVGDFTQVQPYPGEWGNYVSQSGFAIARLTREYSRSDTDSYSPTLWITPTGLTLSNGMRLASNDDGTTVLAYAYNSSAGFKSTDGGVSFSTLTPSGVGAYIQSIEYYNGKWYCATNPGTDGIRESSDGETWVPLDTGLVPLPTRANYHTLFLLGSNKMLFTECFTAANSYTPVIHYFDGSTWAACTLSGTYTPITSTSYVQAFMLGSDVYLLVLAQTGTTWGEFMVFKLNTVSMEFEYQGNRVDMIGSTFPSSSNGYVLNRSNGEIAHFGAIESAFFLFEGDDPMTVDMKARRITHLKATNVTQSVMFSPACNWRALFAGFYLVGTQHAAQIDLETILSSYR